MEIEAQSEENIDEDAANAKASQDADAHTVVIDACEVERYSGIKISRNRSSMYLEIT